MNVALVLPTKGDVDLAPILEPFAGVAEVAVWDNSVERDLSVYGRYAAIERTTSPVIMTVDDDNVLPTSSVQTLLDAYEPGAIVCNLPERFRYRYPDSGMVGFGAIFDRDLPAQAFARFYLRGTGPREFRWGDFLAEADGLDVHRLTSEQRADLLPLMLREADLIVTMLNTLVLLDLPYIEMPYARDPSRLWMQDGHGKGRDRMRELCRQVLNGAVR